MTPELQKAARDLASLLAERRLRIVFAESCTAGLVSATLAQVPGVSQWHCGSAVTYREATKVAWLKIPQSEIGRHNVVSEAIARRMANGVLEITPEAEIAAAITGHLGPESPPELDGVVYISIAWREPSSLQTTRVQLSAATRLPRQHEAARRVLQAVAAELTKKPKIGPGND